MAEREQTMGQGYEIIAVPKKSGCLGLILPEAIWNSRMRQVFRAPTLEQASNIKEVLEKNYTSVEIRQSGLNGSQG